MITTVCMNPSFDKTATVSRLAAGHVNRLGEVRYDAGGKGVNVAIVLRRLGVDVSCVGCLGAADQATFLKMVEKEGVPFHFLSLPGNIRTNLKILDLETHVVTEFNEPGLAMPKPRQEEFFSFLKEKAQGSEYAVLSGKLPEDCAETTYLQCMQTLPDIQWVLDAAGDALLHGLKGRPFLVKPNLPELEAVVRQELRTLRAIRDAALSLVGLGAQNVIVSMGKFGALFTDGKETLFSPALSVESKSTVGAGDAMIGGVLMGLSQEECLREAFCYGMAAGAASVMTDGTQLIRVKDFQGLLPKVTLQTV